ncbi:MAG: hypothetical protein ACRDRU_24795 [Pseudonocardiaceae bacterium]
MNDNEYPAGFSPDGLTEQLINVLLREVEVAAAPRPRPASVLVEVQAAQRRYRRAARRGVSGGRWWCSACGPALRCAAEGHQFSDWHEPPGDQGLPGERAYRHCRRCCLHEGRALVLTGAPLAGEVA